MSSARTVAAFGIAALMGCGGEPPPQAPVAPPPTAPAGPAGPASEPACNELFIGITAVASANAQNGGVASLTARNNAAAILRNAARSTASFNELRAQLKRAVELDKTLAADADEVDHTFAGIIASLDAVIKAREGHAKQMRELLAEVDRIRAWFQAPCGKKDADCNAKRSIEVTFLLTDWSAASLPRARGEIQKLELRAPEAQAKRTELVQKLEEAERALVEQQKQLDSLLTAGVSGDAQTEGLTKSLEKLYAHCGVDKTEEKAVMAVRRPPWVTSKEPDLRKMVMIVRVVPEGRIRARLDEWAQVTSGARREAFEGATHGGFGSGFFVMPRAGEAYIVTNRHVVDYGDHAFLVMPDGTSMGADIVYTDPTADLAILKPAKTNVTYGLGLEPDAAKDHQVVIATGYPGLDAKPSYQTTRGYVSNQRFLDSYDGNPYIQHTAPIDKGGSGGPLTSERLGVMGVNTLKIHARENVAMSVPATFVAEAVARADAKVDAESLQKDARAACMEVVAELGALKPNINVLYRRISLSMVADSGSSSFNSQSGRDRELAEMLLDSPIDALRAAVVDRILFEGRAFRINPYETCATPDPDDWQHISTMDRVRFHIRVGAETKVLVVRREHGRFQLLRLDLAPPSAVEPPKKPAAKKPAKKPQTPQK